MTHLGTRMLALLTCALVGLAPGSVSASATAAQERPAALSTLVSIKARHAGDVDRVVFRFAGGVPGSVVARWVDTLAHDGSGAPVRVAGSEVLALVLHGADAHEEDGTLTAPTRTVFALPNVLTAVRAGDFEGDLTVGLGVQKRTAFTVRTRADRVVVDVAAAFPTTTRRVWFVDRDAVATGAEPHVAPVDREVPAGSPAAGVLQSLFAGPTRAEKTAGLTLVRSRAWGFDDLEITDGIARLRLARGCKTRGSTITVADQVVPTLKQFPTVDWVKIYAPGGRTEQPSGPVDSVPACLEP